MSKVKVWDSAGTWDDALNIPRTRGWDTASLGGVELPGLVAITGTAIERKLDAKKPNGGDGAALTHRGTNPAEFKIKLTLWTQDQLDEFAALVPQLLQSSRSVTRTKWETPKAVQTARTINRLGEQGTEGETAPGFGGTRLAEISAAMTAEPSLAYSKSKKARQDGMVPRKVTVSELVALDVFHPALELWGIRKCYVRRVTLPQPGTVRGTMECELDCVEFFPMKAAENKAQTIQASLDIASLDSPSPAAAEKPSATNGGP